MTAKVLFVTNDFPPRRGGIESFVSSLCAGLPPDEIVVYTASMTGAPVHDSRLGFPVIRDQSRQLLPTPRVARAVQDAVRRYGCDRVVFGAAAPLGLLARDLRGLGVRRMVGLTHGHEVWWAKTPGTRQLMRRIGDDVDVLTFVSDYCKREIAGALSRTAAQRMVRLSPGVDVARFEPRPDGSSVRRHAGLAPGQPVVLAAARLVARKGHDMLLRAWPRVLRRVPDAALLIVGDGPSEPRLRRLAARLAVADQVHFATGVPWDQMPTVYSAADVFALPCRTRLGGLEPEAFGIVYLEAAAAGLPVVVGASGGAPETVVDGATGYLVDPVDTGQIAERVVSLLIAPAEAAVMGAAGRAWVAERWPTGRAVQTLQQLLS